MKDQLFSSQNSDLNNDLATCIDNSDNQMTFVGRIVYLCRSGANDATRATNKLFALLMYVQITLLKVRRSANECVFYVNE